MPTEQVWAYKKSRQNCKYLKIYKLYGTVDTCTIVIPGGIAFNGNIYVPGMLLLSIMLGASMTVSPNGNKEGLTNAQLESIHDCIPVADDVSVH